MYEDHHQSLSCNYSNLIIPNVFIINNYVMKIRNSKGTKL